MCKSVVCQISLACIPKSAKCKNDICVSVCACVCGVYLSRSDEYEYEYGYVFMAGSSVPSLSRAVTSRDDVIIPIPPVLWYTNASDFDQVRRVENLR